MLSRMAKDTPLWKLLADVAEPEAEKPSVEAVGAAVEADPVAAMRPFAAAEGWAPSPGALVRLRPGLDEMKGLRAGEVAAVTKVFADGDIYVKRLRDGKPEGKSMGSFSAADLVHVFDGWLPLQAAAAFALDKVLSVVLEADPAAAATTANAGGKCPLHLAASAGSGPKPLTILLEAHTAACLALDSTQKMPFDLIPET